MGERPDAGRQGLRDPESINVPMTPPSAAPPSPEPPRVAGVLIPVFALRGIHDDGIGDTAALAEFIDWAADAGFRVVKLLPINETGGDHSPYNAISSRALEPALLSVRAEWLPDLADAPPEEGPPGDAPVDYPRVKAFKREQLGRAHAAFRDPSRMVEPARRAAFETFAKTERDWLEAYTLFRVLMEDQGSERWSDWPESLRSFADAARWLQTSPTVEQDRIAARRDFHAYVQWQASEQWREVHRRARVRGVQLMGDIPFGVNFHGADTWSRPEGFRLAWSGGTPPDRVFKHDEFVQRWGQNWGIPLYDWDAMARDDFAWWRQRVRGTRAFFDLFRIDHILGFYRIYGFPWRPEENATFLPLTPAEARERCDGRQPGFQPRPDDTDENRERNRADGERYLRIILAEAGAGAVVGEDLGEVPDYVRPSLTALGIAGYKVPQWEAAPDGTLTPGAGYPRLSLATYATHDHPPLLPMWEDLLAVAASSEDASTAMAQLLGFAGVRAVTPVDFSPALHEALLAALFRSNSWLAVVMITDVFGWPQRFNLPGVAGTDNWTQRLPVTTAELPLLPGTATVRRLIAESGRV